MENGNKIALSGFPLTKLHGTTKLVENVDGKGVPFARSRHLRATVAMNRDGKQK